MKTGLVRQVIQSFFGLEHRQTITRLLYAIIFWRAALITDWQLIFILALISIGFSGILAIIRLMDEPTKINFNGLVKETLLTVHGDLDRLLEALQNLIDNACKFMGGQDSPRIEIGQDGFEGKMPVLYVRDNGIGIQVEFHENIFGLFNNLDIPSEGTGVGLALARRVVEFSTAGSGSIARLTEQQHFSLLFPKHHTGESQ